MKARRNSRRKPDKGSLIVNRKDLEWVTYALTATSILSDSEYEALDHLAKIIRKNPYGGYMTYSEISDELGSELFQRIYSILESYTFSYKDFIEREGQ